MQSHHHTQAYFCMVVRGPLHERRGSNQACFESGSVHFHPAHDPHSGRTSAAGAVCLSIVPKGSIAERIAGEREETPRIGPSHFMTRLAARCHLAFHEDDDASVLCVEAAALELTAGLLRHGVAVAPRHRPRWLDSVREHLDLHFTGRVTLRDLAALAGVHEVHVVRAFRRHEGLTPGAYLRRRRIDAAPASARTRRTRRSPASSSRFRTCGTRRDCVAPS